LEDIYKHYLEKKNTISCQKSSDLILEGTPVNGLYFVFKGKAKVTRSGFNGRNQIMRIVGSGEIIGHRGFGASQHYQISAKTLENTILCNFPENVMEEMLKKIPELTYDFMRFYAEELNRSETKVRKFAQMTVREKVIDVLLYINRKFAQKKGFLNLQLTRKEIADFAGTTEEQVIRVLSALKKEGLLQSVGKKLGISNVQKLKKEIAVHNYFIDS